LRTGAKRDVSNIPDKPRNEIWDVGEDKGNEIMSKDLVGIAR